MNVRFESSGCNRHPHRVVGAFPRLMAALLAVCALFTLVLAIPRTACAKSYEMTRVDIDATVTEDGSLAVRETRTFAFDGSFHGVYWKIPTGTYKDRTIGLSVKEVSVRDTEGNRTLEASDAETEGTYQVIEGEQSTQIKLFSAHSNTNADFTIAYTYTNLATRWQDTAELYWKFVSDGWDEPSGQVTCRIHLPAPAGADVRPGENVRAWGHGPHAGHVAFEEKDVVCEVPTVATSEFAEVRIAFPAEWLSAVEPASEARLSSILAEEQAWADEANAERDKQRSRRLRNCVFMGAVALVSVVYATLRKLRHSRRHRGAFTGTYFRDLPSHDHPVVLASLLEFREQEDRDVIARLLAAQGSNGMPTSIMRLADEGVIALEKTRDERGRLQYRLTETGRVGRARANDATDIANKKIDRATLKLLFDVVADQPKDGAIDERRNVLMSDFAEAATSRGSAYERGWSEWGKTVADAYAGRGFKTKVDTTATIPIIVAAIDALVALGMGFVAFTNGVPIPLILVLVAALVAAGIWCVKVELSTMYLHTPEAYDLMGKTEALKRWLCDFTRLEEVIPTDVVLWNQMLVISTALGVSKEVLKQLKVKVPQLFANPAFTAYDWYRDDRDDERNDRISPMDSLLKSVAAADAIARPRSSHSSGSSSSDYDSSDYSSGSGRGGGFSSGGGGGFGGGGGGGAF